MKVGCIAKAPVLPSERDGFITDWRDELQDCSEANRMDRWMNKVRSLLGRGEGGVSCPGPRASDSEATSPPAPPNSLVSRR